MKKILLLKAAKAGEEEDIYTQVGRFLGENSNKTI